MSAVDDVIPAFHQLSQDAALRGTPAVLYQEWAHANLCVNEHRPVKLSAVAFAVGIGEAAISRALKRLTAHGYLERGLPDGRLQSYRLVYSRRRATLR